MNESDLERLKRLVDEYGLSKVVTSLGVIAANKAQKLRADDNENIVWLDWESAARWLIRTADYISIKMVSP
jgi:hypothetical protein